MAKNGNEGKVAEVVATDADVVQEGVENAVTVRPDTAPAASGIGNFVCEGGPTVLDWTWVHLKFEMSKHRTDGNQGEFYLGRDWEAKLCDKGGNVAAGQIPDAKRRFEFVIVGRKDGYKHYVTQAEFAAGVAAKHYYVDPAKHALGWKEARQAALDAGETIGNDAWHDERDPATGAVKRVGPTASEFMQLLILVKRPADLEGGDELFTIPLNGEYYSPAYLEFDKLNWKKAYACLQSVINAEINKNRVDPKYAPCVFDKVFWGYSSVVERNGKVVTTPMMMRAIEDGKPVTLPKEAVDDLRSIVSGAAEAAVSDETF